ncbi:hypothetical protein TNIN_370601, partial [Trichonephila inaurata madagascariensis]
DFGDWGLGGWLQPRMPTG